MTNGEAQAVFDVLEAFAGHNPPGPRIDPERAVEQAKWLAERAGRQLMAGPNPEVLADGIRGRLAALDTTLATLPGTVTATVTEIECVIRSDNRAQAELVAMRHGWVARFTPVSDEDGQPLPGGDLTPAEWVSVRLLRDGGELR